MNLEQFKKLVEEVQDMHPYKETPETYGYYITGWRSSCGEIIARIDEISEERKVQTLAYSDAVVRMAQDICSDSTKVAKGKEKTQTQKLFRVETEDSGDYQFTYVVAAHPTEAHEKLVAFLDNSNIGPKIARQMRSIKLVAEYSKFPGCKIRLVI